MWSLGESEITPINNMALDAVWSLGESTITDYAGTHIYINVDGEVKQVMAVYANIDGVVKPVVAGYVNINGSMKGL
jgi:hypothetical protein